MGRGRAAGATWAPDRRPESGPRPRQGRACPRQRPRPHAAPPHRRSALAPGGGPPEALSATRCRRCSARTSGPVRKYCTEFACASPSVAVSSLGHVAGPHLPHCVLATNDDPPATSAQNLRTDPLARQELEQQRVDALGCVELHPVARVLDALVAERR